MKGLGEILYWLWFWLKQFAKAFLAVFYWIYQFIGGWKTLLTLAIIAAIIISIRIWLKNK